MRLPIVRRMRFMRYDASPYDVAERSITWRRNYRNVVHGITLRWDMRCYLWVWRTSK